MNSETFIKQFLLDNQYRLSQQSLRKYCYDVKQLIEHTGKNVDSITKREIRNWLSDFAEKGCKPKTIRRKLTALKTFFKYCEEEGFISTNPASKIPLPFLEEKLPSYLTLEKLTQLRQLADRGQPVDRVIIEVLFATGMRISELSSLRIEDIQWSERTIVIPKGKQKKWRMVLFTRECEGLLKEYLESRMGDTSYVIASSRCKDRPMHPDTIRILFRTYSKQLGFRVTPHTLRHTFAAHLAQKGMPLEYIQYLLGHEDPDKTRIYARLYNQARKDLYDEFI